MVKCEVCSKTLCVCPKTEHTSCKHCQKTTILGVIREKCIGLVVRKKRLWKCYSCADVSLVEVETEEEGN